MGCVWAVGAAAVEGGKAKEGGGKVEYGAEAPDAAQSAPAGAPPSPSTPRRCVRCKRPLVVRTSPPASERVAAVAAWPLVGQLISLRLLSSTSFRPLSIKTLRASRSLAVWLRFCFSSTLRGKEALRWRRCKRRERGRGRGRGTCHGSLRQARPRRNTRRPRTPDATGPPSGETYIEKQLGTKISCTCLRQRSRAWPPEPVARVCTRNQGSLTFGGAPLAPAQHVHAHRNLSEEYGSGLCSETITDHHSCTRRPPSGPCANQ